MKVNTIVFSPTGGTQRLVDILAGSLGEKGDFIDLSAQDFSGHRAQEGALYIIAAPTFSSRIARIVRERLSRIEGSGARAIALVSYGNRGFDDSLLELSDLVRAQGFKLVAGLACSTEHSIFRDFATGRPDEEDAKELRNFAGRIKGKLEAESWEDDFDLPGQRPYEDMVVSTIRPIVDDEVCIDCLDCAHLCPLEAIPLDNPRITDDDSCIACMRCIAICPSQARSLHPLVCELGNKTMEHKLITRKENYLYL